MKNYRFLVTGGAGYIGSHVVNLLIDNGHSVTVIDSLITGHKELVPNEAKLITCDIADQKMVSKIIQEGNFDLVMHFAGLISVEESVNEPERYNDFNVNKSKIFLNTCFLHELNNVIFSSTASVYGASNKNQVSESDKLNPLNPYALSKYLGECAVFHWNKVYNLPVNSICIFNAYGTRVRTTGVYGAVFGVFLKQKLEGKPFTIVGDGSQARDFVYATDVAEAFYAAATSKISNERFNVGGGNPQSINYLVQLLKGDILYLPKRPGEPDVTFANINKIQDMLKWQPKVSFENGVACMLDEINHWKDAPLWDKDNIEIATRSWFKYMGK